MKWDAEVLNCIVALVGGCLGAAISALGGFVLFGLLGVLGFLYLIAGHSDSWMVAVTGTVLLRPSVCFLGGVVAAAYARRKGLIHCGKDIGRSFIAYDRVDILAVGAVAGLAGHLINRGIDALLPGRFDPIALTVVLVPLVFKYQWQLTVSSDCEASSHAVPSPYRFFEKFSRPKGKVFVSLVIGLGTSMLTLALFLRAETKPYAGFLGFFASALLLFPLFMSVPVPATHHFSGPAGAATVVWLSSHSQAPSATAVGVVALWGIAAAQVALAASDILERIFFTEGDIHIDPPAMGIFVATAVMLGLIPLTGVYGAAEGVQIMVSSSITVAAVLFSLRSEWARLIGVKPV